MEVPWDHPLSLRRRVVSTPFQEDTASPASLGAAALAVPLPPIAAYETSTPLSTDNEAPHLVQRLRSSAAAATSFTDLNIGKSFAALSSWSRRKWYGGSSGSPVQEFANNRSASSASRNPEDEKQIPGTDCSGLGPSPDGHDEIKVCYSLPVVQDISPIAFSTPLQLALVHSHSLESSSPSLPSNDTAETPSFVPIPAPRTDDALLSASVAATALSELGVSLRWSQKFPEGTHMERAKSRSSLQQSLRTTTATNEGRFSASSRPSSRVTDRSRRRGSMAVRSRVALAELREGLRFLAKKRSDVEWDRDVRDDRSGAQNSMDNSARDLWLQSTRTAQWKLAKWLLFISVIIIFLYSVAGVVSVLLTWGRAWDHADVSLVADSDIIIFLALASSLALLTSVVGICGTILNSRPLLALYAFLLWPTLISMLVVGYSSYKRANLMLDRKLNMAWSRYYGDLDRLRVQNSLHCCGFYSTLHEATFSSTCYPRTPLPGCKGKLYRFESAALRRLYTVIFTLVFVHLGAIATSLLCANHVNRTFGKGLTPRAYRLDITHVRRNAVSIMKALAEAQTTKEQREGDVEGMRDSSVPYGQHDKSEWRDIPLGEPSREDVNFTVVDRGPTPSVNNLRSTQGTYGVSPLRSYSHHTATSHALAFVGEQTLEQPALRDDPRVPSTLGPSREPTVSDCQSVHIKTMAEQDHYGRVPSSIRHIPSRSTIISTTTTGLGLTMHMSEEDASKLRSSGLISNPSANAGY